MITVEMFPALAAERLAAALSGESNAPLEKLNDSYLIGRGTSNERLRETGKLAAEALINATLVDFAFLERGFLPGRNFL